MGMKGYVADDQLELGLLLNLRLRAGVILFADFFAPKKSWSYKPYLFLIALFYAFML